MDDATVLSSDDLPIIIEVQREVTKIKATKRTYVNSAKAEWNVFKICLVTGILPPRNLHLSEKKYSATKS